MAFNCLLTRVLVALSLFCSVFAATPSFDAYIDGSGISSNITVAVNVPSNGTDDLFLHFSAPKTQQWAAFGFGSSMRGSLMFIMHLDASGQNVVLSPRLSSGHSMPVFTDTVKITPMTGTGLTKDGVLVFDGRCTGCRKWTSGSIDITSEQQSMIYAVGPKGDALKSSENNARISQHSSHSAFSLNMKKATGNAGVPLLTAESTTSDSNSNGSSSDNEDGEERNFPIAVHAFLLIACFVFVLPGGYLFLRVFNKVWLHAGIQSLGVVCLIGGVVAGIVVNTQQKRAISYHQVLGIVTTAIVFAAFTLGLISHQYFKKRKVSSPLMKYHRIVGPSSLVFGWGTIISGFAFRGEPRRILPFMVVLLAVIIFISAISFLMKKRAVKKAATETPAAQNFNAAYYQQSGGYGFGQGQQQQGMPPPAYANSQGYYAPQRGEAVPMQTFGAPREQYKEPNVTVHPGNRI